MPAAHQSRLIIAHQSGSMHDAILPVRTIRLMSTECSRKRLDRRTVYLSLIRFVHPLY